jgi:2-polyprenyl-6-methoxyphenol hydroxylase-like FAD-dependent oxidoreductase
MARRYRVGVVGFGVAGGVVAYLLARDGHAVTVLEQADRLGPVGAGVLLQPSGQAVLAKLGWLERVLERAAPLEELYARHPDGREMINNRYPDSEPGCRAYGIHRGVLFTAIHDAVRTQPVEVRLTCRITGRSVGPDGVHLTDSCGNRYGPFDFVLATDGSRSAMRTACRFPAHVTRYDHGTLWINAPGTAVRGRLLQVVQGCRKLFGLLPLGDGLCSLYWGLPVREFPHLKARGLPALKQEVLKFAPEAAEVLDFVHDLDQLILTTYQHVWMPRWFDRHTLFLGDAAHAMSPHLGQGINLAMLDADRFADCLRTAPDPYTAFHAFRRARRAHVRYYGLVTYFLSPFFQSDWPILGWGRDVFLPLLPKVPWVKRQMLLTMTGLKGGFLKGRLAV